MCKMDGPPAARQGGGPECADPVQLLFGKYADLLEQKPRQYRKEDNTRAWRYHQADTPVHGISWKRVDSTGT